MATRLPRASNICQVAVKELRVVFDGPIPQVMAGVVLMDRDGTGYGKTVLHQWDSESDDLLAKLLKSLEAHAAWALTRAVGDEEGPEWESSNAFQDALAEDPEDDLPFG
jgi:hypothetical protein